MTKLLRQINGRRAPHDVGLTLFTLRAQLRTYFAVDRVIPASKCPVMMCARCASIRTLGSVLCTLGSRGLLRLVLGLQATSTRTSHIDSLYRPSAPLEHDKRRRGHFTVSADSPLMAATRSPHHDAT
jgi:hypothetical protein